MAQQLKPLKIGDLEIGIPIIQGGMGIRVSTHSLAAAVAECGGAGTIASVGLGFGSEQNEVDFRNSSAEALRHEIRRARELTDGVVGVNIMVALSNYEDLVKVAVEESVDFIASGAGLPMRLPELTAGSAVKLLPIISSAKAATVITRAWNKRHKRTPDAFIVEGPLAGGHLGFAADDLENNTSASLESITEDVIKAVRELENRLQVKIPVIAAGGIFDGRDIARFLALGADGVQMATRFVTTDECDVAPAFKQAYLDAQKDDIMIIKSPVGMPGRAVKTPFIEKAMQGKTERVKCRYRCLKTCNPPTTPYCISKALYEAVLGNLDQGLVFAGSEVDRIDKIVSVSELLSELVEETAAALAPKDTPEKFINYLASMNEAISNRLSQLQDSTFLNRFDLSLPDLKFINENGLETIRRQAIDFIRTRVAPQQPNNDGQQTPIEGHPVFIAQHATATCCRSSISKWHGIEKGRQLTEQQINYLVDIIMAWIERQTAKA